MAPSDTRSRTTWGSRLRFLTRFLGLAGVLAVATGAVLALSAFAFPDQWTFDTAKAALGEPTWTFPRVAVLTLAVGLGAVVLALVVELIGGLFLAASRRTAAGTTATVATVAAVVLAVIANVYSFTHYRRYDLTRDRQFTLPADIADELRRLRPDAPTTIVVFQQHRTAGRLTDKPDGYDFAAEQKVVEKVHDLVDQFREFGPRFRVVVLDVQTEGYDRQLADLTKDSPELKAALDAAPENSIFFSANGRVQRLGFNEFLQLDKTASKEAGGGRGNLVLLPQGVEHFARRILAVQERRPKVAVCVIHGVLGTGNAEVEDLTHAGLKKVLTRYGFDVTDIVLKRWGEGEPQPAAYTREESTLEVAEGDLDSARDRVRAAKAFVTILGRQKEQLGKLKAQPVGTRQRFYIVLQENAKNLSWLEVVAVYRRWIEKLDEKTEPEFVKELAAALDAERVKAEQNVAEAERERAEAEAKVTEAMRDERPIQDRRMTDVRAKFAKLLADVDLLIVPRLTVMSVTTSREIPPELYALSKEQVEAIRDYMKTGRPVLAMMGPISEPNGPSGAAQDGFERLLAERGIELGRDTVVFDAEARVLARGLTNQFGGAGPTDIPPLAFEDHTETGQAAKPNPVGAAVRLTGRSVEQKFDLKLRALRPVYLADGWQAKVPFAAEFVLTGAEAWNEEKPFPLGDRAGRVTYVPRFDAPREDDKRQGTHAQERRGPFPVAVAVESLVPAAWYDEEYARERAAAGLLTPLDGGLMAAGVTAASTTLHRPTERLMVFGSGGVFVGTDLKPAQEKFLLHSVNWLVNRPDRLPTAAENEWSYPRVELTDRETTIWRGATGVLMPLAAVFLGLLAVMVRRTR
jgi:hypothetical protein